MDKKNILASECSSGKNPLVSLGHNFGNAENRLNSNVTNSIQHLIPGNSSPSDILTEEYLQQLSNKTKAPNYVFDFTELCSKINVPEKNDSKKFYETYKSVFNLENKTLQLINEYDKKFNFTKDAEHITIENLKNQSVFNKIWNEEKTTNFSKEYLSQFDKASTNTNNKEWINEYFTNNYTTNSIIEPVTKIENNDYIFQETYVHLKDQAFLMTITLDLASIAKNKNLFGVSVETLQDRLLNWNPMDSIRGFLENPYNNEANSIEKAKEKFLDGNINEAILHYESFAWRQLGLCHAENENDTSAITALRISCNLVEDRKTMLSLAVSLANEGLIQGALYELKKWYFTYQCDLNIQSQNIYYDEYMLDSENDPILWNRLGASLANNDMSVEALDAYSKALKIFPSYVRARYNLGIACMNLHCYRYLDFS